MPAKKVIVQCSFRISKDKMDTLKAKVAHDQISIQKFGALMVSYYLRDNKEIMRIVNKFADENNSKKRRHTLDELEADKLLELIEEKYSPLSDVKNAAKEFDEEEEDDLFT